MNYDSTQLQLELKALQHNKEITTQQFHKICGAIEVIEAMIKNAQEKEKKEAEEQELAEANKIESTE